MIDSSKYQHITYEQIDDMKHTIGFNPRSVTGTKYRKYVPYRNYYCAPPGGLPQLDELVEIGFMEKSSDRYYHVTGEGRVFLEMVTGVQILLESR